MNALGTYSNLSLYTSMVVLTLAMLAYALDLSRTPGRSAVAAPEQQHGDRGDGDATTPVRTGGGGASGGIGGIAVALATLATAFCVLTVVLRGMATMRPPVGNMYEFSTTTAAFTMLCYLVWASRTELRWLGTFVTAATLLLLGLALAVYAAPGDLMPSLKSFWLGIHVTVATLSVGLFTLGFALAVLQLLQQRRERGAQARQAREVGGGDVGSTGGLLARLPRARRLEQLTYAVHVVAFPLWTFTVIAGAIWAQKAWGAYWNWDPKEVWSFVIWVLYAAYLHARATAGWGQRWAPRLALAGYVAIILNFAVVNYFFVGMHSYAK